MDFGGRVSERSFRDLVNQKINLAVLFNTDYIFLKLHVPALLYTDPDQEDLPDKSPSQVRSFSFRSPDQI